MGAEVVEKKRTLDAIYRARALLESVLEMVNRRISLTKAGMNVSEVVRRHEFACRPIV